MIDIVARLYSLIEGKDRRCNNHEGDVVDKTNKPSTCAQHSPPAIDEPLHSTDSIEPAMDINTVKSLKEAIFTKVLKPIKSMKPVISFKVIKAKEPPTSLAYLFFTTATQIVGGRRVSHAAIVCEGTIVKYTFNIRSVYFRIHYQIV